MKSNGLLMVIAEPPPGLEEEYNAWFDTEHFPERLAIEGFLGGHRFVSAERERRYLVLYDLTGVEVLHSDGYRAHTGDGLTPWSRRIVARQRSIRHEASQIFPGRAKIVPGPLLLLLRFDGLDTSARGILERWGAETVTSARAVLQVRLFTITDAAPGSYLMFASGSGALAETVDIAALGPAALHLSLMETFLPY